VQDIIEALEKEGMKGVDISENELAKSHVRYMSGGCQVVENERVFRFGVCLALITKIDLNES
jgi:threonine dehydratase